MIGIGYVGLFASPVAVGSAAGMSGLAAALAMPAVLLLAQAQAAEGAGDISYGACTCCSARLVAGKHDHPAAGHSRPASARLEAPAPQATGRGNLTPS